MPFYAIILCACNLIVNKNLLSHITNSIVKVIKTETEQQERMELQCRKLLLDFYSSELTTHSRLIIGFAIILLTILEITQTQKLKPPISFAHWIALLGIFTASLALCHLLMRHLTYGISASAATHASPSKNKGSNLFERIKEGVDQSALEKRILFLIPSCLFYSTGKRISWLQQLFGVIGARVLGVLLCVLFAFSTTFLLVRLIGLV